MPPFEDCVADRSSSDNARQPPTKQATTCSGDYFLHCHGMRSGFGRDFATAVRLGISFLPGGAGFLYRSSCCSGATAVRCRIAFLAWLAGRQGGGCQSASRAAPIGGRISLLTGRAGSKGRGGGCLFTGHQSATPGCFVAFLPGRAGFDGLYDVIASRRWSVGYVPAAVL